jgi:hypothetical protein
MFLWASLMFKDLEVQKSTAGVRQALRQYARQLQTLYTHSLERICKAHPSLVDLSRFALGWLTDGFRALTVSELNAARQIETGRRTLDTDFRLFDMSRTLKLACGQLIRILPNDIVTLTCFSTKEFFVNQRMTRTPSFLQEEAKVHLDLGVSWANYLFMDAFIAEKHQIYIREIHMSYPLTDYAVMQWHVHLTKSPALPWRISSFCLHFCEALISSYGSYNITDPIRARSTISTLYPSLGQS